jgi:small subunit ribosomal protein S3Ae
MVKKTTKTTTADNWKRKGWFKIIAPPIFNNKEITETPAMEPELLKGRKMNVTLREVTGNIRLSHLKARLEIIDVKGNQAITKIVGHEIQRDFTRRLVRRRMDIITSIITATTKDNFPLRVTTTAFTRRKGDSVQVKLIRSMLADIIKQLVSSKTLDDVMREFLFGKISSTLYDETKKILPMKRVEVVKSVVIAQKK